MKYPLLLIMLLFFSLSSFAQLNKDITNAKENFKKSPVNFDAQTVASHPLQIKQLVFDVENPGKYMLAIYVDKSLKQKHKNVSELLSGEITIYNQVSGELVHVINLSNTEHRNAIITADPLKRKQEKLAGYAFYFNLYDSNIHMANIDIINNKKDEVINYSIEIARRPYY